MKKYIECTQEEAIAALKEEKVVETSVEGAFGETHWLPVATAGKDIRWAHSVLGAKVTVSIDRRWRIVEKVKEQEYVDYEPVVAGGMWSIWLKDGRRLDLPLAPAHKDFVCFVWAGGTSASPDGWFGVEADGTRKACKAVRFRVEK